MEITHYSNSFLRVKKEESIIICDPWVGNALHGSWHSFPEYDKGELSNFISKTNYVYISHLHSDHLDPYFLKYSDLITKTFIIKKFRNGILKRRLLNLGVDKIIELDDFQNTKLNKDFSVMIIPQMTTNSSEIEDTLNYDLDTSLVINDGQHTFFNQVDNPLSDNDFKKVCKIINDEFGYIDIACFVCGSASEYPQCFLKIDRFKEQFNINQKVISSFLHKLEIAKPKITFLAGASYFISGKNYHLNQAISLPSFEEVKKKLSFNTNLINLEGGYTVNLADNKTLPSRTRDITPTCEDITVSIQGHKDDNYDIFYLDDVNLKQLKTTFNSAHKGFNNKIEKLNVKLNTSISFLIYNEMNIISDMSLKNKPISECNIEVYNDDTILKNKYIIHIDLKTFYYSMTKKLSWNQIISGSHCLLERDPEIFLPEVLFSLNLLTVD